LGEKNHKSEEDKKMAAKEQRLFRRIVGLFLLFYAFLILAQPLQYGFGFSENFARLVGLLLAIAGIYLALKQ
jgi:hypothetical protein